jgi:hypothetical protein
MGFLLDPARGFVPALRQRGHWRKRRRAKRPVKLETRYLETENPDPLEHSSDFKNSANGTKSLNTVGSRQRIETLVSQAIEKCFSVENVKPSKFATTSS